MRTFDDVAPGEDAESVRRSLGIGRYSRDGAHLTSPRPLARTTASWSTLRRTSSRGWRAWLCPRWYSRERQRHARV